MPFWGFSGTPKEAGSKENAVTARMGKKQGSTTGKDGEILVQKS